MSGRPHETHRGNRPNTATPKTIRRLPLGNVVTGVQSFPVIRDYEIAFDGDQTVVNPNRESASQRLDTIEKQPPAVNGSKTNGRHTGDDPAIPVLPPQVDRDSANGHPPVADSSILANTPSDHFTPSDNLPEMTFDPGNQFQFQDDLERVFHPLTAEPKDRPGSRFETSDQNESLKSRTLDDPNRDAETEPMWLPESSESTEDPDEIDFRLFDPPQAVKALPLLNDAVFPKEKAGQSPQSIPETMEPRITESGDDHEFRIPEATVVPDQIEMPFGIDSPAPVDPLQMPMPSPSEERIAKSETRGQVETVTENPTPPTDADTETAHSDNSDNSAQAEPDSKNDVESQTKSTLPHSVARPIRVPFQVAKRAGSIVENGIRLADRNAYYTARSDFIHALQLIAQTLDVQTSCHDHSNALAAGLRALREANDLVPPKSRIDSGLSLTGMVIGHRTPVLKDKDLDSIPPFIAMQMYFAFAQDQLAAASGNEPVASDALFALGKLQMKLDSNPAAKSLNGPRAMALFQAALLVDPRNAAAANELGVLLARYGRMTDARRVLLQSLSINPRSQAWYNLSVVHRDLGETELSRLAENEWRIARRAAGISSQHRQINNKPSVSPNRNGIPRIQWVSPEEMMPDGNQGRESVTPTDESAEHKTKAGKPRQGGTKRQQSGWPGWNSPKWNR